MTDTHDDLIDDLRLQAMQQPMLPRQLMLKAADALAASQTALREAEADNARLRALLAGAVSREAAVKACNPHPDDGHLDRQCKWECQAAIDALPALAQHEGGSDG